MSNDHPPQGPGSGPQQPRVGPQPPGVGSQPPGVGSQGYPGVPPAGEPLAPMPSPPPTAMPSLPPTAMPGARPGGMPGAMPGATGASGAPVARPGSVTTAVRLMYAGAVLSLLSVVLTPLMADDIRTQMREAMASQPSAMAPDVLDALVTVVLVVGVVFGLLGVALWLLMAWANGKGKSWARIVATVLFGVNALSVVGSLVQNQSPPLLLAVSLLVLLVGAAAVFLLWRKDSTAYFRAQSAPRY